MANTAKLKRVMKKAGKLRADGKTAKQAMKMAWADEKGTKSTTKKASTKKASKTKTPKKSKKKFLGIF